MGQHKIKGASLGAKGIDYKRLQGKSSRLKGPRQPAPRKGFVAHELSKRPRSKRGK